MSGKVVIIGGGLAGITAALRCADAGREVVLLEGRPRLGGLTHSFRRGDLDVDNGQHVFLRCCTAYRALLDRIGATAMTTVQRRLDVPVVRLADGRRSRLHRDAVAAPLHLARSLASYSVLSPADRVRAVRGALALRDVDRSAPATDDVSFGDWLRAHGQTGATIDALWDLVGVATANLRADHLSLAVAATVFQIGLLTDSAASDVGWSLVPLQRLHGDNALRAMNAAGVRTCVRCKVDAVEAAGEGWLVRTADDEVSADAVVVATDAVTAERLTPEGALDLPRGWSRALGASPIVNVHVVFDRPVMPDPFVAGVGGPVQWVFDRTRQAGLDRGQYVAVSLSAADDAIGTTVADLRREFVPALRRLLPAARHAVVRDVFVTREAAATFRAAPGTGRLRPGATTRAPGLFIAGAYTATGWPATMESAVRSGDAAAAAVVAARDHAGRVVAA